MESNVPEPESEADPTAAHVFGGRPLSRRRFFEVGGAGIGLAALLAACNESEPPAPGRVGNVPEVTDLPQVEVNDAVFLRTMTSLEHSIIDAYAALAALEGLGEKTAAALTRFSEDHMANAASLAELTTEADGEPYECANPWLMDRAIQPAVDHIVGTEDIPATDDAERDSIALANALETLASATYQQMVEKLTAAGLRAAVIPFGAQAARHSATITLIGGITVDDTDRRVAPTLVDPEAEPATDSEGFTIAYAIPSRFGQLTPIEIAIGAPDDGGTRYSAVFETPADNAYRYDGETCPAA